MCIVHRMNDTQLSVEISYKLFKLVEENPELSQRELAKKMGVSLGKLNYCMKALVDVGLIKIGNFNRSRHKLGYVYMLTPSGVAEKARITARFLARRELEYEALRKEIESLRLETKREP